MEWTVTEEFFRDCLIFIKKHYSVIGLDAIQNFLENGAALPDYPLLVTFDDGWLDNLEYALPITQQYSIRPLLFVTTGAIGKPMLSWQEVLYSAWRIRALPADVLQQLAQILQQPVDNVDSENDVRVLIRTIQHSSESVREAAAEICYTLALPHPVQMLNREQLNDLASGFDLGAHGVRHERLTQSSDPAAELQLAREQLQELTGQSLPISKAFPHGRQNDSLIQLAKDIGYTMIFTGSRCHTRLKQQSHAIFGRHNMNQLMFQDARGRLRPDLLAMYLFRQPIKEL